MRNWMMVRCHSDGSSCSDVKAVLLGVPAIALMVSAFWSINLF
jgi:hypothetical protein